MQKDFPQALVLALASIYCIHAGIVNLADRIRTLIQGGTTLPRCWVCEVPLILLPSMVKNIQDTSDWMGTIILKTRNNGGNHETNTL